MVFLRRMCEWQPLNRTLCFMTSDVKEEIGMTNRAAYANGPPNSFNWSILEQFWTWSEINVLRKRIYQNETFPFDYIEQRTMHWKKQRTSKILEEYGRILLLFEIKPNDPFQCARAYQAPPPFVIASQWNDPLPRKPRP